MKFIQMSATMAHEESEPIITALNNKGEIWEGYKVQKRRQFEITYEANLTGAGPSNPRKTLSYVWDRYMHWELIVCPDSSSEDAVVKEILLKRGDDPTGYLSHKTISIREITESK